MWPRDNVESWQVARQSIEELPDDAIWSSYKETARAILSALEKLQFNKVIRAGMSMHDIIFSTLDHHVLRGEPRVTLRISIGGETVKIAYSYSHIEFGPTPPVCEENYGATDVMPPLLSYLKRLWVETKPNESLPHGLS